MPAHQRRAGQLARAVLENRSSRTDRRAEQSSFRFGDSANSVPDLLFLSVMPDTLTFAGGAVPRPRHRGLGLALGLGSLPLSPGGNFDLRFHGF
jgi:hypothetical protein